MQILLATALVKMRDKHGQLQVCRVLLDSGSQSHFITEECVQHLGLKKERNATPIHRINEVTAETKHSVKTVVLSYVTNYVAAVECLVILKISANLPGRYVDCHQWNIPTNLHLAQTTFNQPGNIDILLEAEFFFYIIHLGKMI
ncbi:hypothetical protein PR048_001912 [Dryococelus australis]|uniref:Peptidase aspartic putative domain-containing protein n=1 Tax=Dryococelus australis TaxID=614101 RepID=A0ABQ9IIP7_9NEOP|nr:hypothetical protein PR048_001912 [Dryococelus australis]